MALPRRTVPARRRRHAGAAAARCDGAGADRLAKTAAPARQPPRLHLRAERRGHGQMDAGVRADGASSSRRRSRPLAPFRDQTLVVSGSRRRCRPTRFDDGGGDHSRGTAAWLSGIHAKRTEGADVQPGVTADQIAAQRVRQAHAARLAGAGARDDRSGRQLRQRLQLRLHEHAVVARRRRRRCRWRRTRARCSGGCSAQGDSPRRAAGATSSTTAAFSTRCSRTSRGCSGRSARRDDAS